MHLPPYRRRDTVTHFVCSNLPDTKLKQLASERRPVPVVRPDWITGSLAAGRLLPVADFQLESMSDAPGQRKLGAYARHEAPAPAAAELYPALQQRPQPAPQPAVQATVPDTAAAAMHEWQVAPAGSEQPLASGVADPGAGMVASTSFQPNPNLVASEGRQPMSTIDDHITAFTETAAPATAPAAAAVPVAAPAAAAAPATTSDDWRQARETAARLRAECDLLKGPPKSTRDDPHFVTSYFKASRLHFIGKLRRGNSWQLDAAVSCCSTYKHRILLATRYAMYQSSPHVPGVMRQLAAHIVSFKPAPAGSWKARIEALMMRLSPSAPQPLTVPPRGSRPFAPAAGSGPPPSTERAILHIDMDCFFVSVARIGRPEFAGKPLAVCHSASDKGTGEVSSASYEARAAGVRASMFVAEAIRRCPDLIVVPYEFEKYETVSEQVRGISKQRGVLHGWDAQRLGDKRRSMRVKYMRQVYTMRLGTPHARAICSSTNSANKVASNCRCRRCTRFCCATPPPCSRCPATRPTWMSPAWGTPLPSPPPYGGTLEPPRSAARQRGWDPTCCWPAWPLHAPSRMGRCRCVAR